MSEHWVAAVSADELAHRQKTVFRSAGKQIVLFHTSRGVFACNNRCPHEGYPLSEGHVDTDCTLTCNWHNGKFDLATGANKFGGDRLRVYPTRVVDEQVLVDLSDLGRDERHRETMRSLRDAFDDHDYTRLARELGRLRLIGVEPCEALVAGIGWSFDRLEFGWTHAYAGAADWMQLHDELGDDAEGQLICVLESLAHMAYDVLRESGYAYPAAVYGFDADAFVQAIEDEDEPRAVGMLRGALRDAVPYATLENALSRAALAHYNDFGHSLIYVTKAMQLINRFGDRVAEPLLLSLCRSLVFAVREDHVPEFRVYHRALSGWGAGGHRPTVWEFRRLGISKAVELTLRSSGSDASELFWVLSGVNAHNMASFEDSFQTHVDRSVADNVGWLDFTHGITFADAVDTQCSRHPRLWPQALLQLACFAGRNAPYTSPETDWRRWEVGDPADFLRRALDALLDHGRDEYIESVHVLKTTLAVRRLVGRREQDDDVVGVLLAALNRFSQAPLRRKHVRRTARQAMKFVAHDG